MARTLSSITSHRRILAETFDRWRSCWKSLALTDGLYKLLGLILLTPIAGLVFRFFLMFSGQTVLADQDILFFFLGPIGWGCAVVGGGLWLAIVACEQAALLSLLHSREHGERPQTILALRSAMLFSWPVLQVTSRIVGWSLLAAAPFLAAAGAAYALLLTEFDINYYLHARPPAFWQAVGMGVLLALGLAAVLLRLASSWCFALPLVIFEATPPSQALRESSRRSTGHRPQLIVWFATWAVLSLAISSLIGWLIVAAARFVVPTAVGSLLLLALAIGVALAAWTLASLAANLLSTTVFSAILFSLYWRLGRDDAHEIDRTLTQEACEAKFALLTTRRLIVGGLAATVISVGVGAATIHSLGSNDEVAVIAHRGASFDAPGNTLASLRLAIEQKADWAEIDVQETVDGQVVVIHDSDLMKLAGEKVKVWDATLEELQQFDIGSSFDPKFAEERVPTLSETLEVCRGKIGLVIELKYYGHDLDLERRVVELVEAHQMASQVQIMSLRLEGVQKVKQLRPSWQVGLLLSVAAGGLHGLDLDFLGINEKFVDRASIHAAHRAGRKVYAWTVDDPATMSILVSYGVDGLITNRPVTARTMLEHRSLLSPPERLLLELAETFGVKVRQGAINGDP